jgi:hypothetical protein
MVNMYELALGLSTFALMLAIIRVFDRVNVDKTKQDWEEDQW